MYDRPIVRLRFALLAALALTPGAYALDPTRALTQSRHSVWTQELGLPQNTVDALVQTRDGYVWMGTEEGLVRFDGMRFVVTDRQNAPALRSSFVSCLAEGPDGTLWIGTYGGGLARMRNGQVVAFHPEALGSDRIRELLWTAEGIFIATAGGGLLRISGDTVTRYTTRDGLPSDRIWALEEDGQGGIWLATHGGGIVRWRGGRVEERISTREGLPNDFVRALLRDGDGTLWIGTDGGGLVSWRDGRVVRTLTTRDGMPSDLVRTLYRDRNGSLWIGTDGGLVRLRGTTIESLGVAQGFPSPSVRALVEDREGNLWVGTTSGAVRLRDTRFLSYTRKEGLSADVVRAVLEDRAGQVWAGTEGGGLCRIVPGPVECRTRAHGLPQDTVYALAESADGSLWIGTDGGGVARLRDGAIVESIDSRSTGLPNDRVRALVETADGGLWVSTSAGLALVRDGRALRIREFNDRQLRPLLQLSDGSLLVGTDGAGLWKVNADGSNARLVAAKDKGLESDRVFSLAVDAEGGGVWIGTSGGGLARLDLANGTARSVTRREGIFDDVVFQVVDSGPGGDLWLTSNRGLYRIARARVLAAMRGEKPDLSGKVYGTADGMPSSECNAAFAGAVRARDGRIWVATARGLAVIDPASGSRNVIPPPVHIEESLIDGVLAPPGPLRVPPGRQRLELRYTALGLRAPELVTFRYILEGYDPEWVDAGSNRVATYTKLAPGDYTFRVVAANEDGVPSQGEARLAVTVEPRWWETWWARLLAVALFAAILWGLVRLRLAALHHRHAELEAVVAERTSSLRAERERAEDINRQLAVANDRLQALSYLDGLTGVANRRRFDEALEEACSAARAGGTPLSLVLIDLDHFKKLNDTQGHQDGDEALRAVASIIAERSESRAGLAARFGGEEFALLLPGVSAEVARAEAETLRLAIREARIRHEGSASGIVTASFGVSGSRGTTTPAALIAAADTALYRAKSEGRDRVEVEA